MLHGNLQDGHEGKKKPKDKSKMKTKQKKSSEKAQEFFEGFHPSITENMEKLNDLYASFVSNFTPDKPNPLNIFSADVMAKTFSETHKVMVNTFVVSPDEWDRQQKNYLSDLEELYQRTMGRLQGEEVAPIIVPQGNDKRFKSVEWNDFPVFDYLKQSYLLHCKYMNELIDSLEGMNPKTKEKAQFYVRSMMDAASPTNSPFTNPEVLKETIRTQGQNLVHGYQKFLEDNANSNFLSLPMFTNLTEFKVGENLGMTEGKVVYETPLFQLLYYKPTTEFVYERPLLMIPPWINKYYIFDLQQENSFVGWLLEKGFSVFVLSWINPDETYADHDLSDYVIDGVLDAVQKVLSISKQDKLNLLAYCTGGVAATLLAGYLAKRIEKTPIESLSLLAAPIDFDQMGDLKVFVCEDQLEHLEKRVKNIGYFPGDEMVRVFSFLRANDLIWSNYINTYLLNKETFPLDFLYWNCDTTHIPATLHMEYLRNIFFENALMHPNDFHINGVGVDLKAIQTPIFAFATRSDHIVPWASAYAIKEMCPDNTTFVLGAAGHVAGIVNPEHRKKYCYWKCEEPVLDSSAWLENAKEVPGSWWPEWYRWMKPHSGEKIKTTMWESTENIEPAPGRYVLSTSPSDNF